MGSRVREKKKGDTNVREASLLLLTATQAMMLRSGHRGPSAGGGGYSWPHMR